MSDKEKILSRIENKEAAIGVVGLGYVGLPLAIAFAEAGYRLVGIDVDESKVDALNRRESYIEDVPSEQLAAVVDSGLFYASSDYSELAGVDAISICVPTPLRKTGDPDISFIIMASDEIARVGGSGKLIILESTTYPGTTEEIILPRLISNGDVIGRDVFLAFSPERIDPGRKDYTIFTTPKVIGGVTPACLEVAVKLYSAIVREVIPVSSTSTAEMVKLLENTFRAVNISLVNEVALMCDKLDLDVWEVVDAATTKPYGFMPFYPGPGMGGHCIPVDPMYLSWKLRTLNYKARFIDLAAEVNGQMPGFVVSKVADALNEERKALNGSRILILGVAYKPNVNDVRESPAMDVIILLQEKGAVVRYHDPYVPSLEHEGFELSSISLTDADLENSDCVLILTHHDSFDWPTIANKSRLIVDTRHAINKQGSGKLIYL
ncbi:MAG TPA: nucleotide sugar dehydrogenase [candidate division Zixibacteria bacterium]|nr:nucleotide sugar dehydrogenase [candidate division Zixibacteria bacterium]